MRKRRHFTAEFNRQRVEQTCQPGNSIAGLAQAHGSMPINCTSGRRKILRTSRQRAGAASTPDPRGDRPRCSEAATGR
jgi:transposase-like protein